MKKNITKLTKLEKQKIENKMLTVFAVALGSVMILLYLINWFQGSVGFQTAAKVVVYLALVGFIFLIVFAKLKSNKFKKDGQIERATKYNNWFIFAIVGAVTSFIAYPSDILSLIGLQSFDTWAFNSLRLFGQYPLVTRLILIMILIGIYTLASFIYYSIYLRRAHKSSLNKGANK